MLSEDFVGNGPWTSRELIALWARIAVGTLLILSAWGGISGDVSVSKQMPWMDLAIGGLVVVALSNALWLLSGMRRVRQFQARLITSTALPGGQEVEAEGRGPEDVGLLVSGPGMTRYHRAGCLMATGKDVRAASESTHLRHGRQPCGLCRP